jgi:hypothetical protein
MSGPRFETLGALSANSLPVRVTLKCKMFLEPSIGTCPLVRRCQAAASQSSRSQYHHYSRLT